MNYSKLFLLLKKEINDDDLTKRIDELEEKRIEFHQEINKLLTEISFKEDDVEKVLNIVQKVNEEAYKKANQVFTRFLKVGITCISFLFLFEIIRLVFLGESVPPGEIMFFTMLISGSFGGTTSYLITLTSDTDTGQHFRNKKNFFSYITSLCTGIISSFCVPLFLSLTNYTDFLKDKNSKLDIFIGLCLVFSIFSATFLKNISLFLANRFTGSTVSQNNSTVTKSSS